VLYGRAHFLPLMGIMLKYPVPLAKEVVDCFVSLVDTDFDVELTQNTFKHLYLVCNETPIEKDKPAPIVQTVRPGASVPCGCACLCS
jgi:hypothetical protein